MRPADQTSWFPFATELAATGDYTVLTFDFRGFGDSTGEKEFDRLDTDLEAALAYMRDELGIDGVVLVGASMGGSAALVVAARQSLDGVVSISSPAALQTVRPIDIVGEIVEPKLFITSEDDVAAARSQEQLFAHAPEPKFQEIYPGDEHGTEIFAGPNSAALRQRLLAFLGGD
jgi:pimeloyl-ACP methyl ester carboxylesterase